MESIDTVISFSKASFGLRYENVPCKRGKTVSYFVVAVFCRVFVTHIPTSCPTVYCDLICRLIDDEMTTTKAFIWFLVMSFTVASILRFLLLKDFFDISTPFVDSFEKAFPERFESTTKGIEETMTNKVQLAGIRGLFPSSSGDCLTCTFDFLETGVFVSRPNQTSKLADTCGFTVTANIWNDSNTSKNVNVFDTANPTAGDFDLGAPHASCGGDPRVNGSAGHKDEPHANCSPQGKALVIQDPRSPENVPNDGVDGGCLVISFDPLFTPLSVGILDGEDDDNMMIEVSQNIECIVGIAMSSQGRNGRILAGIALTCSPNLLFSSFTTRTTFLRRRLILLICLVIIAFGRSTCKM